MAYITAEPLILPVPNLLTPITRHRSTSTNVMLDASSFIRSPQSPRKTPRCKQCQQPRKGHPRSGCPVVVRRVSEDESYIGGAFKTVAEEHDERGRGRSSPNVPPVHPPLASLTAEASSIAGGLRIPGALDAKKDTLGERIEQWRKDVPPSTLGDQTPPTSPQVKMERLSPSTPRQREKKPLLRTMSTEERIAFLEHLKYNTKRTAQVFIMNPDEIPQALEGAKRQGLHGGMHQPAHGGDAFLVIGADKETVDRLLETVRAEQGSPVRNQVAGAVVGAVAMWAGLAYS